MTKEQIKKIFKRSIGTESYWSINKHLTGHIGLGPTQLLQHLVDVHGYEGMNKMEWFYQQYERIARDLYCDEKTIQRRVVKLKECKLIETKFEKDQKDRKMKTWFKINYDQIGNVMDSEIPIKKGEGHLDTKSSTPGHLVQTKTNTNNTNRESCSS
jgi:hypothetical protein